MCKTYCKTVFRIRLFKMLTNRFQKQIEWVTWLMNNLSLSLSINEFLQEEIKDDGKRRGSRPHGRHTRNRELYVQRVCNKLA